MTLTIAASGKAAVFDDFDTDRHIRAVTGAISVGSSLPVRSGFLINESEITGVGLNSVALITPQHFITADHITTPGLSRVARFRGSDGIVREYRGNDAGQVIGRSGGTDIRIYTLDNPIPDSHGIRPLRIATSNFQTDFQGREIYVFGVRNVPMLGQAQVAGRNTINVVTDANLSGIRETRVIEWVYNKDGDGDGIIGDEVGVQGGDSGSPVLIRAGGELALIGANFGRQIGVTPADDAPPYRNYASWLGAYEQQINDITMASSAMTQGFAISTISVTAVPEPGSFAVCALIGGLTAWRTRRKTRSNAVISSKSATP